MAKPRKRKYNKRNKGKIKIRKSVRLVHKNDKKKKKKSGGDTIHKAPFIMNDNGLNMRIKIKRKSR